MASKVRRLTIPHLFNPDNHLRVTIKVQYPSRFNNFDEELHQEEFEDDETSVVFSIHRIEDDSSGRFVDVTKKWINDDEAMEALDDEIQRAYGERALEKYVDRMGDRS